jgi:hypothetical protein
MAANASARGQRAAILSAPLTEFRGFCLAVDCLTDGCRGERSYTMAALAACYSGRWTVGEALRRMRCGGCGGRVSAAWLVTGEELNTRIRPRRVPLWGPEAKE